MVVYQKLDSERIDRLFRALADATRRDILERAANSEQTVSELAARYKMSFAAVQKHVSVLEDAELIIKRADGRMRLVRTDPARLAEARTLLDRYLEIWRGRVERLDAILAEPELPSTAEQPRTN